MRSRLEGLRDTWVENSPLELLAHWYQVPALLLLMGFMFWTRIRSFDNFVRGDEVFFSGNDAYYHFRQVSYTVQHWPRTMPYDPWTQFPTGTSADQFGTLFDQLIATSALLVGLGSPSTKTVALTLLVAPAVFAALVAIPVYYIGKRLGGRPGGLFAVFVLALLPGAFFQRSTVGFSDHHIGEVLFQSIAVLTTMVALSVAEREKPVYELFLDRDWTGLRRPLIWSALSGVGIGLYLWAWPPAVVLVGILGVFYLLALSIKTARGRSPEHLAIVGVVSLSVSFVMTTFALDTVSGFGVTSLSLLQLSLIAAVAAGCAFMAGFARIWEAQGFPARYYPIPIGGLLLGGVLIVSVVLPNLFSSVVNISLSTFGFGQTDTLLTIAEAKAVPFDQLGGFMYQSYGLLFLTAAVGLLSIMWHIFRSDTFRAERLLVVVWAIFTTLMALTQVRFNYYLAVVVAVLNVWLFSQVIPLLNLPTRVDQLPELETYQILSLLVIGLVVIVPLAPPVAAAGVMSTGENVGPGSVVVWDESLDWLATNSPPEGTYGNANNPMAYYGTYERTDDFDYPDGAYGVMSWWDYGHWITVEGRRIPIANPFQANARPASAFLLADSEAEANLILEALPSTNNVDQLSEEELQEIVNEQSPQEAQEDTRYVIIDDQMAAGKFSAIATWTGPGPGTYFSTQEFQVGNTQAQLYGPNQDYHETMLARLYFQDARQLSHYRLVHETERVTTIVSVAQQNPQGQFQTTNTINRRLSQQLFTAVQQRPDLAFYDVRQASTVKTYERVPGATLTGQVNTTNATTVFATVPLQTNTGRNFTYVQTARTDSQGNFELTVPYATTNTVGPDDGGTDSGVVARELYTVFSGNPFQPTARAQTEVPEPAIYDGKTITVELEPIEQPSGNESDSTNESNSSSLEIPIDERPPANVQVPTVSHTTLTSIQLWPVPDKTVHESFDPIWSHITYSHGGR